MSSNTNWNQPFTWSTNFRISSVVCVLHSRTVHRIV